MTPETIMNQISEDDTTVEANTLTWHTQQHIHLPWAVCTVHTVYINRALFCCMCTRVKVQICLSKKRDRCSPVIYTHIIDTLHIFTVFICSVWHAQRKEEKQRNHTFSVYHRYLSGSLWRSKAQWWSGRVEWGSDKRFSVGNSLDPRARCAEELVLSSFSSKNC